MYTLIVKYKNLPDSEAHYLNFSSESDATNIFAHIVKNIASMGALVITSDNKEILIKFSEIRYVERLKSAD